MAATLEREIKLPFESADTARAAVTAIGATPLHGRRLQEDCLLDTANDDLRRRRSALRVRQDGGRCILTFKGPVQQSDMKLREEVETIAADGALLMKILGELGYHVWFRCEKYREEFALDDCIIAIDETPVGVFVEIEGGDRGIAAAAELLGFGPGDYVLESYRGLFIRYCEQRGLDATHMLFDGE